MVANVRERERQQARWYLNDVQDHLRKLLDWKDRWDVHPPELEVMLLNELAQLFKEAAALIAKDPFAEA